MTHSEQLLLIEFFHSSHPARILLVKSRIRSRQKPVNNDRGASATHSSISLMRSEDIKKSSVFQGLEATILGKY